MSLETSIETTTTAFLENTSGALNQADVLVHQLSSGTPCRKIERSARIAPADIRSKRADTPGSLSLAFLKLIIILMLMLGYAGLMSAEAAEFGVARTSTPVLNTPDFKAIFGGADGQHLKADHCGQLRELEYIALPGSVFTILKKQRSGTSEIYQVETDEYTASPNIRLYVDRRFLKLVRTAPAPRNPSLPPLEKILSALRASVGSPYVWGGNVPGGVPELASWFYKGIGDNDKKRLTLAGLDCSGLLYQATGGWTPRNTSQLVTYGQSVAIAGKPAADIATILQPLDLIVWNGHVIIVLDQQNAIESRLECGKPGNGGVVMTQLPKRIAEIIRTRCPVNVWLGSKKRRDIFVVRRWYAPQISVSGDKTHPSVK